ncbi:MAG: hypothetical protein M1830_001708, partial [Pleopsidium flavum]
MSDGYYGGGYQPPQAYPHQAYPHQAYLHQAYPPPQQYGSPAPGAGGYEARPQHPQSGYEQY